MLKLLGSSMRACDGVNRRRFIQVGGLSALGLSLPELLRAEQAAGRPSIKSCILLYCFGGPSQHDIWDMKPDAPADVRGEFQPIATNVAGTLITEHLPKTAKHADKFSIIRSVTHKFDQHNPASFYALTGHPPSTANLQIRASSTDHPPYGAVLANLAKSDKPIPPFVSMPLVMKDVGNPTPGQFGGWLGRNHDPFFVVADPSKSNFKVPALTPVGNLPLERFEKRMELLNKVNEGSDGLEDYTKVRELDSFQQRALALIASPLAKKAFDLGLEPDKMRERYGRHTYGQSALLARRLIEAGTRMVTLQWGPEPASTWDTHGGNFKKLKDQLLPQFDAAYSSLLEDLADKRMLDDVLVVVMGEFGRTPKVNKGAGRDHWPGVYSVALGGAGIKRGVVVGKSDKLGAYPAERPVSPQDVAATIYSALGVKPDTELLGPLNRPLRIVADGQPISELV